MVGAFANLGDWIAQDEEVDLLRAEAGLRALSGRSGELHFAQRVTPGVELLIKQPPTRFDHVAVTYELLRELAHREDLAWRERPDEERLWKRLAERISTGVATRTEVAHWIELRLVAPGR